MELLYCNIFDFPKNIDSLFNSLTKERQSKMLSYIQTSDRLRCLGAGLLMSYGLGQSYTTALSYNSYGKPLLVAPYDNLFFNLSHSGDYVVLALSSENIGVDVQQHESGDYLAMSKISFHLSEQKYLESCKDKKETFYKFWTLKESYLKTLGTGFSLNPNSFEISMDSNPPKLKKPSKYSLFNVPFCSDYSLGICSEIPLEKISPKLIKF